MGELIMPIQLSSNLVGVTSVGGTVIDTRDTEAIGSISIDYIGGTITVIFTQGTPASNAFQASLKQTSVPASITLNTVTGAWTANGPNGTLTAPQLASVLTVTKNIRNTIEQFAVTLNIISGTFTAWT